MAVLNIRNLPDEVHARLRIRAAKAGRSMEAEARAIIAEACSGRKRDLGSSQLQALAERLYGEHKPQDVVEELIRERRRCADRR